MTTITATYRIVTPMFCSGADPKKAALRLSSFKGALRFWWRTLQHGMTVSELQKKEAAIFGSSRQSVGQSKVRMRLKNVDLAPQVDADDVFEHGRLSGAHYLGYGMMNPKGRLDRAFRPSGVFDVEIRYAPSLTPTHAEEIRSALIYLGTFGALGSRARKGFGSLNLINLSSHASNEDLPSVKNRLAELSRTSHQVTAEWTAWSSKSRIVLYKSESSCLDSLNNFGKRLGDFRLWQGNPKESNFVDDHDSIYEYLKKGTRPNRVPARAVFGLPHNYFYRSLSKIEERKFVKAEIVPAERIDGKLLTRRASPLFVNFQKHSEKTTEIIAAFLPSKFLPKGQKLSIKDTSSYQTTRRRQAETELSLCEDQELYSPIMQFLDSLCSTPDSTDTMDYQFEK